MNTKNVKSIIKFKMDTILREFLENIALRIEEKIIDFSEAHLKNIERLEENFKQALEFLLNQKKSVEDIISFINTHDPNAYFSKISEVARYSEEQFEHFKASWKIPDIEVKSLPQDLYKTLEIFELKNWVPVKVEDCVHKQRNIVLTLCGKGHCSECLKTRILKKQYACFCAHRLSPKNMHEIMDFDFKIPSNY